MLSTPRAYPRRAPQYRQDSVPQYLLHAVGRLRPAESPYRPAPARWQGGDGRGAAAVPPGAGAAGAASAFVTLRTGRMAGAARRRTRRTRPDRWRGSSMGGQGVWRGNPLPPAVAGRYGANPVQHRGGVVRLIENFLVGFMGLVGLWLGHNYRRQLRLQLTGHVLSAYRNLWQVTGLSPSDRLTTMTRAERDQLAAAMDDWYYAQGQGMLLPAPTRKLFFVIKQNLTAEWRDMQPPSLLEHLGSLADPAKVDEVSACTCNRELSLLRSQMKSDLAFYTGGAHLSGRRRKSFGG